MSSVFKRNQIAIRLTDADYAMLLEHAKVHSCGVTEYARLVLLKGMGSDSQMSPLQKLGIFSNSSQLGHLSELMLVAIGALCMDKVSGAKSLAELTKAASDHVQSSAQIAKVLKSQIAVGNITFDE